jgi:hypothetical protein
VPHSTSYKIQCWGACSGLSSNRGGWGAYTCGNISLSKNSNIYIYVGEKGYQFKEAQRASYNGGGAGTGYLDNNNYTGGGATDIRLTNGDWDNFNSLKSRIMVAAGGGGVVSANDIPGYAGGLTSNDSRHYFWPSGRTNPELFIAKGATQTSGYKFGIGATGDRTGGGGGYYGGNTTSIWENSTRTTEYCASSGGSSFISGHTGCNAINSSSTENNISHSGSPNHYSGKVFTNTVMKAGDESMPSTSGGTETGHSGNGYAKITWMPVL